jgi:hypothetical protein
MNATVRQSIIGAGIGMGLMFLLDPARGNRRRALIRDKMISVSRKTRDAAGATRRDIGNRITGIRSRAQSLVSRGPVDDDVLVERVRARLGRIASHPRAIDVAARNGCVTLTGDAFAAEISPIMDAVARVRGVWDVENEITPHAAPEGVPFLQDESERTEYRSAWMKSGWSPSAKVVGGAALLTMAAAMARRRM